MIVASCTEMELDGLHHLGQWVQPIRPHRFVFYYELVPIIGSTSDITYGEWINEVGTPLSLWSLSLEDNQWIEVKSATSLGYKDGQYYNYVSYILSESGYMVRRILACIWWHLLLLRP